MRDFELFVPRSPRYYVNIFSISITSLLLLAGAFYYPELKVKTMTETVTKHAALSDAGAEIIQIETITAPAPSLNEKTERKNLIEPIELPKFDGKDVSEKFLSQLVSDYPTVSSNKTYKSIIKEKSAEIKNILPKDFKESDAENKDAVAKNDASNIVSENEVDVETDISSEPHDNVNAMNEAVGVLNNNAISNTISNENVNTDIVTADIKNIDVNGRNIAANNNPSDNDENTTANKNLVSDDGNTIVNNDFAINNKNANMDSSTSAAMDDTDIDKEKYSGGQYPYEDVYLLAQLIRGEAPYEGRHGMVAVAEVVLNRVNHEYFPNTVSEVIQAPGQFANRSAIKNRKPTEEMVAAAYDVLNRNVRIFNKPDVVYFRNPRMTNNIAPEKRVNWGDKTYYRCVGSHAFYLQKK